MSWRGSPALAGSFPYTHHLTDGKRGGDAAGRMTDRPRGAAMLFAGCWSIGGDVVAIASPRSGRGGRPSLSLSACTSGRCGERLAMVWTAEASDGTEERRGTVEEVGGILRPGSLSFCFVCLFALPYPHHLKEENEDGDEAGRMADRRGAALVLVDRRRGVGEVWR